MRQQKPKALKQAGFGIVELLLLIVIIGLLLGLGWFVWHTKRTADQNYQQVVNTKTTVPPAQPTPGPPSTLDTNVADWQQVTSVGGAFTVKLPSGWQLTNVAGNSVTGDQQGTARSVRAVVLTDTSPGAGGQKRFVIALNSQPTAKVPAWTDPGSSSQQAVADYVIGGRACKKYTATWTKRTVDYARGDKTYQYVCSLPGNRQLNISYRQGQGDADNAALVGQVIQTIVVR